MVQDSGKKQVSAGQTAAQTSATWVPASLTLRCGQKSRSWPKALTTAQHCLPGHFSMKKTQNQQLLSLLQVTPAGFCHLCLCLERIKTFPQVPSSPPPME